MFQNLKFETLTSSMFCSSSSLPTYLYQYIIDKNNVKKIEKIQFCNFNNGSNYVNLS
jgi:hypothetical protein